MTPAFLRVRGRGAALVLILAFILLLSALVTAYFSYSTLHGRISHSTARQTVAEVFAQGALGVVTSDLRREIADGSVTTAYGTNRVYRPLSGTNAVPARVGTDDTLPNLVKRSASGLAFYPGGPSRASSVSSTNAALNGRLVPAARWNLALLLPKASTNSSSDLTPAKPFVPPDWIYVARDGSNPKAWSDALRWTADGGGAALGRYAYAIYDEGSLLDANAAGYPPQAPSDLASGKGSQAGADLSVLPGMTTNAVSALVGWRNYASCRPSGSFPSYSFAADALTNYFAFAGGVTSGFLRTSSTNTYGGRSDRLFVSRQQLIALLTKGAAQNDAEKASLQNALQYLSTFSRDLEQPSFRPAPNRPKNTQFAIDVDGGNDTYSAADPTVQDRVNPSLLDARTPSGDPVMKRRFPLSRLALVKPDPSSADAAKIKDWFGLTWDATRRLWVYDHGGAAGQILSLYDPDTTRKCVAREGREPDFFEILRAFIHCDSLGKQNAGLDNPNKTVSGASTLFSPHMFGNGAAAIDGKVNYQVIQIGLNLIDQYDEDSYPTRLSFDGREFYGVENLPYLAGWETLWYRMKALAAADMTSPPPGGGTVYETWVMLQPILWNPHVATTTAAGSTPTDFRILAGAMTDVAIQSTPQTSAAWWGSTSLASSYPASAAYAAANAMTGSGTARVYPPAVLDPASSILTFSTGSGDAAFREPFRLRAPNYPAGSKAANDAGYVAGRMTVAADPGLVAADGGSSDVIGFFCGKAWTGPRDLTSTGTGRYLCSGKLNRDLKLTLQYKSPAGDWITYDVIEQVYTNSGRYSTVDNPDTGTNLRAFRTALRGDPRTDRWGLFQMETYPTTTAASLPAGTTALANNGVESGSTPFHYLPQGVGPNPSSTASFSVVGNNSGLPNANGWSSRTQYHLGDLMANLPTASWNPNTGTVSAAAPGLKLYYTDPDGMFRRAPGGAFSGNDGLALYAENDASRPVVLNRPFHSVAEMGYAFRGQAWRDLDFSNPESGDAPLLDAFCLNELDTAPDDMTVAGRVNLNTRQIPVLQALLSGASKAEGGVLSGTEASKTAQALAAWTLDTKTVSSGQLAKGPLLNRSELVGKFLAPADLLPKPGLTGGQTPVLDPTKSYAGFASLLTASPSGLFAQASDAAIKRRRECVLRALVDSGTTRTWCFLVDLVAQVGRFPEGSSSLSDFAVEGETRVWLHIAIDRWTGQVIARLVEPVSE